MKLISLIGRVTRRCIHSASRTWSADSCLFLAEEGSLGGLELSFKKKKKKKNEKLRGAMPRLVRPWPIVKVHLGPGSTEGDWR